MTVTPNNVGTELGRPNPDQATSDRYASWIDQARYLIGKRLDITTLDPADVDYVVLQSVAAHARHPGDETQVTVSADDGSTSKTYRSGNGRVTIVPELWTLLDPNFDDAGAFSVTPTFTPDTQVV